MKRYNLLRHLEEARDFELVIKNPESTNVCFWYLPPSLQGMESGEERDRILNRVAPRIKAAMMQAGNTMIGYQPQGGRPNFFRYVCANPAAAHEDVDFLLKEIRRLGKAEDEASSYLTDTPLAK